MSKRQLAMAMDLNKCLGCQACTMACKVQWTNRNGRDYMYWNHVETLPGKGYPRNWQESGGGFDATGKNPKPGQIPSLEKEYGVPFELNYGEALGLGETPPGGAGGTPLGAGGTLPGGAGPQGAESSLQGAKDPWLRPETEPVWGPNWDEDQGEGEYPNSYYFYLPRLCNHCTNPACLQACPRRAIYKRPGDGIVLIDLERCRGYQHCVAACPYKKSYFNPLLKRSEKCLLCFPRVEQGLAPACARQCPGRVRFVGYLDDRDGPVWKLVAKWKVALPLRADYGTQPNVYYVPPLSPPRYDERGEPTAEPRLPMELLVRLFGPRAPEVLQVLEAEREKRRRGEPSELMDLLIAYRHAEMFKLDGAKPDQGESRRAPGAARSGTGHGTAHPDLRKGGGSR